MALAVLMLLVFGMLEDRRTSEHMFGKIELLGERVQAESFFQEWDDTFLKELLKHANRVSLLATANFVFLDSNSENLKQFLSNDGIMRVLLVDPSGNAIQMESERRKDLDDINATQISDLKSQIELSISELRKLSRVVSSENTVQIKIIDHLPPAVITIIERDLQNSIILVTLNGFAQPHTKRPSFILQHTDQWHRFYKDTFENLWNSSLSKEIIL